jgi:hypothetical protein
VFIFEHSNGGGKYSTRYSTRALAQARLQENLLTAWYAFRQTRYARKFTKFRAICVSITATALIVAVLACVPAQADNYGPGYDPSGTLTPFQIGKVLSNAGFSGDGLRNMIAISWRESNWQTGSVNTQAFCGSAVDINRARGLYQICGPHSWNDGSDVTISDRLDAWRASQYAFQLSVNGTTFWGSARWGSPPDSFAYSQADLAIAAIGGSGPAAVSHLALSTSTAKSVAIASSRSGNGYWELKPDGGVFSFGDAGFYGSAFGYVNANNPAVAMARTDEGGGYWIVAKNGAVYSFGNEQYRGGANTIAGHYPIMGIAPHGSDGYWLLASDGGVFSFGSAPFKGSATGRFSPILAARAIAPTGTRNGYWIVNLTGAVYSFGDAAFRGGRNTASDGHAYVGMAQHDNDGYWLLRDDGGIYSFGSAPFKGSAAGRLDPGVDATGMARMTGPGEGYWITTSSGAVAAFGDAKFAGRIT